MSESQLRRDVAAWVRKAEEDRGMALSVDPGIYANGICFHCQQCIEKYLKATLVAHDVTPDRIHDLVALGTETADHAPEVEELFSDLAFLTPYSVLVRYPDRDAVIEEAHEAIEVMERARAALRIILGIEELQDHTTNGAAGADYE